MRVGDKKQVAILSVVAVAAVIVLATQLGSTVKVNAVPRLLAAISGGQPLHQGEAPHEPVPEVVTRDAFSHPKLEMVAAKTPKPAGDSPAKEPLVAKQPADVAGSLGSMPTDPGWFQTNPDSNLKPAEITRGAEKENEAPGVPVKLLATMRASAWRAMIQVGTGDSTVVSQGQTLAEGIQITKIGEEGITLRQGAKTSTLKVGGELKL